MHSLTTAFVKNTLRSFPAVRYAFAYGSGAFVQPGLYDDGDDADTEPSNSKHARSSEAASSSSQNSHPVHPHTTPMLDFVFLVDDPAAWHKENIRQNPHHYSWLLSKLGSNTVCAVADHVGVGVHFNTMVPMGDRLIKYGVSGVSTVADDLTTWRHLYLAGRLQKPVAQLFPFGQPLDFLGQPPRSLVQPVPGDIGLGNLHGLSLPLVDPGPVPGPSEAPPATAGSVGDVATTGTVRSGRRPGGTAADVPAALRQALASNVESATAAALLLLPERFTTYDLMHAVVGLSYNGDIRMGFAEDSHKVDRIVTGSWDGLLSMYLPHLSQRSWPGQLAYVEQLAEDKWQQSSCKSDQAVLTARLPVAVLHEMSHRLGMNVPEQHFSMDETRRDVLAAITKHQESAPPGQLLAKSLASIVRRASAYQAVAGLLTVSTEKSVQYVYQKMSKAWASQGGVGGLVSGLSSRINRS